MQGEQSRAGAKLKRFDRAARRLPRWKGPARQHARLRRSVGLKGMLRSDAQVFAAQVFEVRVFDELVFDQLIRPAPGEMPDQRNRLRRWTAFDPPIRPAVRGAGQQPMIAQPPAQQRMVGEQMVGVEARVDVVARSAFARTEALPKGSTDTASRWLAFAGQRMRHPSSSKCRATRSTRR